MICQWGRVMFNPADDTPCPNVATTIVAFHSTEGGEEVLGTIAVCDHHVDAVGTPHKAAEA